MNSREILTSILIILGSVLALLPSTEGFTLKGKPDYVAESLLDADNYLSTDELAKLMLAEDSTLRYIDLRNPEEFNLSSLPGAVNIPWKEFVKNNPADILPDTGTKNILVSEKGLESGYAFVLAKGMKIDNV